MIPQDFKVGQQVRLNLWTITPIYGKVERVGNTFIEVRAGNQTHRIRHDQLHKKLMRT